VFYYLNIMIALFSTEQRPRRHNAPLHWAQQAGGIMTLGLMLLMLVIGLYPQPLLELIQMANPR
jgi:NADH-quinone oxidoreductase subunit N